MTTPRCALAVMGKAPQAGRVKTRLVPPLTSDEARGLSACFLSDITENIGLVADATGFVAYAPAGTAELFDGLLAPGTRLVLADGEIAAAGGLVGIGRSLLHAAAALLGQGFGAVCLINADSPTLPTSFLRDAVAAYRLASLPWPGVFGVFYQASRPTKNALEAGLIAKARGSITVLDRAGLEERTCECYAAVKLECERLLPPPKAANQGIEQQ